MKIKAVKDNKGNVIISEESLELILKCLDNEKFLNDFPENGDGLSPEQYFNIQSERQEIINAVKEQTKDILSN